LAIPVKVDLLWVCDIGAIVIAIAHAVFIAIRLPDINTEITGRACGLIAIAPEKKKAQKGGQYNKPIHVVSEPDQRPK
jgi:hypothetical protein